MEILDYFYYPNRLLGTYNPSLDPLMGVSTQFYNFNPNRPEYYEPGMLPQESQLSGSLNITALDVENSEAGITQGGSGGPQRTNSSNRLGTVRADGGYEVRGSSPYPLSPTPGGGILRKRNGQQTEFTLNAYTPHETYMQSMKTYKDRNKKI